MSMSDVGYRQHQGRCRCPHYVHNWQKMLQIVVLAILKSWIQALALLRELKALQKRPECARASSLLAHLCRSASFTAGWLPDSTVGLVIDVRVRFPERLSDICRHLQPLMETGRLKLRTARVNTRQLTMKMESVISVQCGMLKNLKGPLKFQG